MELNVITLMTVVVLLSPAAGFTKDFTDWLEDQYGESVTAETFTRTASFGSDYSFGGRRFRDERLRRQPVIFVHGLGMTAHKMSLLTSRYRRLGYTSAELYGSTWVDRLNAYTNTAATCQSIRRVRRLIIAVARYTQSRVDVVAHSMGVPLSRKAILGGHCVDTGEPLGRPLTKLVDTFVGVAGANLGLPYCSLGGSGTCNRVNGMFAGDDDSCRNGPSAFLKELDKHPGGFEGNFVFSIYSKADFIVPWKMCNGRRTSALKKQNGSVIYSTLDHIMVLKNSFLKQIFMIRRHRIPKIRSVFSIST